MILDYDNPSNEFSTFAIGSTEPETNVGPWLKDGKEWFIFDDETKKYISTLNRN